MPPPIFRKSKLISYYGQDIFIEAWQPEGGQAFVHLIEAGDLPPLRSPDCGMHPTLDAAIDAGMAFATTLIDS